MAEFEEFVKQIDEELEAENIRKLMERYRVWVLAAVVFLFAGLFSYVGWNHYRQNQDRAASDLYLQAEAKVRAKQWSGLNEQLAPLQQGYSGHGYGRLGRFLQVRALMEQGQGEQALQALEKIIESEGRNPALRDLALLNAAYVTATDAAKARGYLNQIEANSGYRPHAAELLGLLAAQEGKREEAVGHYREGLAGRPGGSLEERLRRRLEALAGPAG